MTQKIKVIIPAYNEEDSIAKVINDIPTIVDEIIVISNNSTDKTEENAANAGATVLKESKRGYGYACLQGMNYISSLQLDEQPSIIVFLDGDYSDYPEQLTELVAQTLNKLPMGTQNDTKLYSQKLDKIRYQLLQQTKHLLKSYRYL